jgi:peptide/nickel transport system permease protein
MSRADLLRKIWRNYYVQRVWKALATIFVVTTLTFFLIRLMPGNPLDIYISTQLAQGVPLQEAQAMAAAIYQIDLDKPVYLQYIDYLWGLLHGDFGMSIVSTRTPVSSLILRFLPWTLFVVTISLISSFLLGILLGTLMAYKRNTWLDHLFTSLASVISAIPNYIVGVLIIVYCGVRWKWFDVAAVRGSLSPGVHPEWSLTFFADALYHAALPILTYVITTVGNWMLAMRSSTMSTLGEDYVMVARARGLSDGRITTAYVGRNAVLPLFTSLAIAIGFVVGGSTLIETVFTYQGIGMKLSSALSSRDYPVMQAVFIIICTSVVTANLLADLLYSWLDPRIRIEGR